MTREEYWKLICDLREQRRKKMQVIECKRVDLWDGGERQNFGFYISSEVDNDVITKVHPNCAISSVVLTVFKDLEEIKENSSLLLRKSAWSKLSIKEREALGMIEEPK
jgi:hypothetical protein